MGDQLPFGVGGQPVSARAEQLVDLGVVHPVVLVVVQHRQQHIQVAERVGQPDLPGQPDREVVRAAPLRQLRVERDPGGLHVPAQRLEQPVRQVGAAPAGQRRDGDLQRQRAGGQLRPGVTAAGHRGAEDLAQRDREHRRGRVGPVVDVLGQGERLRAAGPGPPVPADQPDRVDLQQQRRGAALLAGFRVEHVRLACGHVEALHPVRVLVQQEAQVRRRRLGQRDGQEHRRLSLRARVTG